MLDHFDGNLVVVPIVYGFDRFPPHAIQAYGQVRNCGLKLSVLAAETWKLIMAIEREGRLESKDSKVE